MYSKILALWGWRGSMRWALVGRGYVHRVRMFVLCVSYSANFHFSYVGDKLTDDKNHVWIETRSGSAVPFMLENPDYQQHELAETRKQNLAVVRSTTISSPRFNPDHAWEGKQPSCLFRFHLHSYWCSYCSLLKVKVSESILVLFGRRVIKAVPGLLRCGAYMVHSQWELLTCQFTGALTGL